MIQLRAYQTKVVNAVNQSWAGGKRAVGIAMPTGAGKTITFCEIIHQAVAEGKRVALIMEGEELVNQTVKTLNYFNIQAGIIMACNSTFAFAPVQVCSIDSVSPRANGSERKLPFIPDLIVVDEAHRGMADSYLMFLSQYPKARILGASATWWLLSGKGFDHIYDDLIHGPYITDLVDIWHKTDGKEGLTPARMFSGNDLTSRLNAVKTTAGDYNQGQLSTLMSGGTEIHDVIKAYKDHLIGRQTFVFAVDIAHSKRLLASFQAEGIAAEHLDGTTPKDQRKGILKRLAEGATQVVCNVGVCTTGVDVPEVSGIILARPTKSLSLYIQMAGRGLRPANHINKVDCKIIDCANNLETHGHIGEDRMWCLEPRKKGKEKKKKTHRPCPQCGEWVAYSLYDCPSCAYHWIKQQRNIIDVPTNVIELKQEQEAILPEVVKFYRRCLRAAKDRGYKEGWAYHKTVQQYSIGEFYKYISKGLAKRLIAEIFGQTQNQAGG